ncbi:endolytic transglycosylase MltG [Solirubrobacter sp. CPCC 204708]|uniref:Endolytic murein transglycosylase n=1 Tax=Solirubrobacter deserti TaxID=2282478 RepID=A0ABT4RII3_9ACTN|nr:endolytic transglycosylase MltG [Solirubrobacter deserti]MBE2316583.1 endolytic transglycosylase MltG [Solirubrobacter deserti]MDA0138115.1 endolytic transglycosylase MltG [Solirubrobacter deserti]
MFGKRSDQPRTAEDRARAAAERAARREGRPLPREAFDDAVPPPDVEPRSERPAPVEEPRFEPEPPPVQQEEPRVEPPPVEREEPRVEAPPQPAPVEQEEPVVEAPRAQPAAEPRLEAASEAARRSDPRDLSPAEHLHQPTVEYTPFQTEEHEAPLGDPHADEPEIVAHRRPATATAEHEVFDDEDDEEVLPPVKPLRAAPPRSAGQAPRKRPAPNVPRATRARNRGRKTPPPANVGRGTGNGHWGRRIFAVVALVVIAGLLYAANQTFQPFHGDADGERVRVTIPENSDAGQIGTILADAGIVDSARFFELSATIDGTRGSLRPGDYSLQQGMSNEDVIAELTKAPEEATPVPTVELTLVEGPSRRENAPVVDKSDKVRGEYAKASGSKETLARIRELGAPRGTRTAEGFLFPATYTLPEGSSANDLVKAQLDAFEENFSEIDMSYAKRKNLSRYDVLIIASLIEREASLARERRLVSAVIYNRLAEGMPLGIDATTRYSTNNWTRPIKQSEIEKDEPFNTRVNRGLPPTPIGNPGLASLKAAANPSRKGYLYYVRKANDDSGEHAFSTTYSEFEKDLARYNASRGDG